MALTLLESGKSGKFFVSAITRESRYFFHPITFWKYRRFVLMSEFWIEANLLPKAQLKKIRHLESNGVITIGVYNLSSEMISLIENLEFVIKTELKAEHTLEILVNSRTDVKPEINRLIVESGGHVFKLIENSLSLEDAFF